MDNGWYFVLYALVVFALFWLFERQISKSIEWLLDFILGCLFLCVVVIAAIFVIPYQLLTGELKWGFWKQN